MFVKQVALNVDVNVVLNKILMSQSVFLLFLRYRFFNYNASVTSGSTWKFNRKQRKFCIFMMTHY